MRAPAAVPLLLLLAACGRGEGPVRQTGTTSPLPEDTLMMSFEGGPFVTSWGDSVVIQPFQLSRTEVTNRLFVRMAREAGIELPPDPGIPGLSDYIASCPGYPAVNMTALEAESAAATLGFRLPTAAEWEFAAMSGLQGRRQDLFPWGSLPPEEAGYPANYLAGDAWDTRNRDGFLYVAPVGSFPLSDAGLADMAGNAAEWTAPDDSLECRVYGGSWLSESEEIRIGSWRTLGAGDRAGHIGFRLARTGS